MTMNEVVEKNGVVPVISIKDSKDALNLGKAIIDGGLNIVEITFRTDAAAESIKILSENYPELVVGAGTVLSIEKVKIAIDNGAKFIVTPCFDTEVVDYCIKEGIDIFPGIVTPSELNEARKRGLTVVKFFPCEAFGGLKTIEAISAPFSSMKFMPTGGINMKNLETYLSNKKIVACGGTWIAKSALIENGEFEKIMQNVKESVDLVRKVRVYDEIRRF